MSNKTVLDYAREAMEYAQKDKELRRDLYPKAVAIGEEINVLSLALRAKLKELENIAMTLNTIEARQHGHGAVAAVLGFSSEGVPVAYSDGGKIHVLTTDEARMSQGFKIARPDLKQSFLES